MEKPEIKDRFAKLKAWAGPVFVLVMLVAALWFLHIELQEYSLQEFRDGLLAIPALSLIGAILLTLLNYAILVCYDWLGIWYIRHPMKFGRVALASFLGYSVGNNFGLLFGGSTIRYRLYSTWGLSAAEIVKLLFILAITFWIGLFALSGVVFLIDPLPMPKEIPLPVSTTRPLGIILTTLAVLYLAASAWGRPLKLGSKSFHPPPLGLSIAQYIVASIDLLVAAGIVYVLLPPSIDVSYSHFVGIFLLAQVAVFITQVPGGLGILEMCLITLLGPTGDAKAELFAALLAYRLIFYLTPMVIGIGMLGVHEVVVQRENLKKLFGGLGVWTPDIAPRFAALMVFFCGALVLIAAAVPVEADKMEWLLASLPLWLIETCYFMAGIFGVLLLLLSRGLYRRIRLAWILTLPALVATSLFALGGSLGFVQTIMLVLAILVMAPVRHYFHRRGKLLTDQIAWHWLIAIAIVLVLSFWIFWFAYKKRDDIGMDFWRVAVDADSQRSLRALLGGLFLAAGFFIVRILQISPGRPEITTRRELRDAAQVVAATGDGASHLLLQGDKRLLFNESGTALVGWAAQEKTCVALGNPVGPLNDAVQIAWDFHEMCLQQGRWPAFFLVNDRYFALFQEMNLQLTHIADEAIIELRTIEEAKGSIWSAVHPQRESEASSEQFQILEGDAIVERMPDLQRIAAAWQTERGGRPHRFSSTSFSPESVAQTPVGVLELGGRLSGFVSLWPDCDQHELAVGLVRYLPEAPDATLDRLLVNAMNWARQQGYRRFSLGPAPLDEGRSVPFPEVRTQMMSIAFRMSRHFFSYQGLRNYFERFQPSWQPLYLATPREKPLGVILADIATLIGSRETLRGRTLIGQPRD